MPNPDINPVIFLGVLLLALSIRIGKSVFLYFNPYLAGVFLQFGMSAGLFIGPSLYFYLKSVVDPEKKLNWKTHYIPLAVLILTIDVLYPWDENHELWFYFFHAIYLIWLVYLIFSGLVIKKAYETYCAKTTDSLRWKFGL